MKQNSIALVLAAILIGLIATGAVYYSSAEYAYTPTIELGLCNGANPFVDTSTTIVTGAPTNDHTEPFTSSFETCSIGKPTVKISDLRYFLSSWKFYTFWASLSLLVTGLGYIGKSYYAHHRH